VADRESLKSILDSRVVRGWSVVINKHIIYSTYGFGACYFCFSFDCYFATDYGREENNGVRCLSIDG
jgi:hypothetical protein